MMEHINMCEVVQDLLPLYEDGCCSRQSRELVEAHLETCEACRRLRTAYGEQMPDTGATEEEDVQGIRKGLRIFVRWRTVTWGILALLLTVVLLVIPVRNHVRGWGLLMEIWAQCIPHAGLKRRWLPEIMKRHMSIWI